MKKTAIVIVLCIVSVGMLSGCVNPLDPKEQFIGTWEVTSGEETSIITDLPTAPHPTWLFIFYRNDTVEYKMVWMDRSSSIFFSYEVTAEHLILMSPPSIQAEEIVLSYSFPISNILVLTDVDTGLAITLNRVS